MRPWKIFLIVYIAVFGILALVQSFSSFFNPLQVIIQKQADFRALGTAQSQLPVIELQPGVASFVKNVPAALDHVFLRPYLFGNPFGAWTALSLESLLYVLLIILLIIKSLCRKIQLSPLLYFAYSMALSAFLIIGYIVPNSGAIVRYRILFIPLLIAPALYYTLTVRQNIKNKNI
jgi:hypothetical protein